ncbi:MAG: TonB-dependent receptor plug domain-containing protein, partial [Flavobacteriales bacterium]|nr:TonB-dependent receptor plug domain-containing protein [Flavobacteriales bacterium]
MLRINFIAIALVLFATHVMAQADYTVGGTVSDAETGRGITGAEVVILGSANYSTFTDDRGEFDIVCDLQSYELIVMAPGYSLLQQPIDPTRASALHISLKPLALHLSEATIAAAAAKFDMERLAAVEETAIYSGMKNEVLSPKLMQANLATNNTRQVYAKVPGINVWENDGAGLQLGIGARGLNPNRTAHFNVRQNGFDISADALGYPESYYTPPLEAVERIELIRGAAALQYGPQFGGLLNFKMKSGDRASKLTLGVKQTVGTYGFSERFESPLALSNTLVEAGGTVENIRYYGFYQHKTGSGWRANSAFNVNTAHFNLIWQRGPKVKIRAEVTHMDYLAKQAGGLTDAQFAANPQQSLRTRNWFRVNWNLASAEVAWTIHPMLALTSRTFGLIASREALGFLGYPTRIDPMSERNMIAGQFHNIGNETRLLRRFNMGTGPVGSIVGGVRFY